MITCRLFETIVLPGSDLQDVVEELDAQLQNFCDFRNIYNWDVVWVERGNLRMQLVTTNLDASPHEETIDLAWSSTVVAGEKITFCGMLDVDGDEIYEFTDEEIEEFDV